MPNLTSLRGLTIRFGRSRALHPRGKHGLYLLLQRVVRHSGPALYELSGRRMVGVVV